MKKGAVPCAETGACVRVPGCVTRTPAPPPARDAAAGRENVLPHILEAVRAYATIGEICDTLRARFGVYRPPVGV